MKRFILLSVLAGALPLAMQAQDDLYFTPSDNKPFVEEKANAKPTYYGGISKSDAEYNRRGALRSSYEVIGKDSLGNDIIRFEPGDGSYTSRFDTIYQADRYYDVSEDDFAYSRRMSRFDGYWGIYSPWYMGRPYYYSHWGYWDPWYSDIYDPWYYGGYYGGYYGAYRGWYGPWGYGYYGGSWGWPYYHRGYGYGYYGYGYGYYGYGWAPRHGYYASGHTGTGNHWANGRTRHDADFRGYRGSNFNTRNSNFNANGTRTVRSYGNASTRTDSRFGGSRGVSDSRFGGSRNSNTYNNTRSSNSTRTYDTPNRSFGNGSRSTFSGGSFSGSRSSGGGSFGGSRGGGGSFGGHRR